MFRDRQWSEVPVPEDDRETSVHASIAAYPDAVIDGREPPVTGAAALETMRAIRAAVATATSHAGNGLVTAVTGPAAVNADSSAGNQQTRPDCCSARW